MFNKQMFSQRLKALREESENTQSQLADAIGISRGSISFYENGDRLPDIEVLHKLARFFHVDAGYLMGDSEIRSREFEATAEQTGLSEEAIKKLIMLNIFGVESENKNEIRLVSEIISHKNFYFLISTLLNNVDPKELEKSYLELDKTKNCSVTKEELNETILKKYAKGIIDDIKRKYKNG